MARVNVVLFDLDDTLLDYSGDAARCWSEACATVAAPAGVDADALRAAIRDVGTLFWSDPERHRLERTDMMGAWRKIVEGALDRCGGLRDGLAARVAADFADRRRATWSLFPDALPALERLRARGIALGLVTNGDAGMQREKIVRWDLARFFDVVVIEGEFGCGKPDARVYRHALETLGAHPRDAWMVGDHLVWDVLGAKQVGVSAAWLDRSRQGLPADAPVVPDRIFGSLADLTTLE
ncbi:MAG: phosphoglycolate phosphatase [Candidatus Rokuibacteriota bacterium]|jgi:putative hydrolase of the HAD superfamily|nr:MAG: phosphoglycolate phosphatase [Candidatus Rokubacteria bacterium]PYN61554.1 MAG: phosphoglycolate phosphatase [Candidatus Rokubacteria bacterium]